MKPILSCLLAIITLAACSQSTAPGRHSEVVFRSVNVIPMDNERVLENQTVVVRDGKIAEVGDARSTKYGKDAQVIESKGKYLMPGLSEMHAHVPTGEDLQPMKEVLLLFATYGITTIRGMLGHPRHLELRSKIKSGEILGPHFITSGPAFSGNSVTSLQAAESMVHEQKKAGYDFFKLLPGLSKENFDRVAKTSKEMDITFAGHVSFDVGVWHAIDAGYSTIDHLDGFIEGLVPGIQNIEEDETGLFGMFIADRCDTTQIPKLMKALRDRNVWVVPTQALAERWFTPSTSAENFRNEPEMKYMSKATLDNWVKSKSGLSANPKFDSTKMDSFIKLRRKLIYECNKAGVGLLLGCDAPQVFNVPGISTHQELQYLVDAGLTPYEALKTGTLNVAKFYNTSGKSGVIKPGAASDLVLLNANPLADITNTRKIEGVMIGTNWLSKSFITETLKGLEKK